MYAGVLAPKVVGRPYAGVWEPAAMRCMLDRRARTPVSYSTVPFGIVTVCTIDGQSCSSTQNNSELFYVYFQGVCPKQFNVIAYPWSACGRSPELKRVARSWRLLRAL